MEESANPAAVQRLFIVGMPRCGTSTLVHAFRVIGFSGFAEGHLLGLLPALEESVARYYDTWKADNLPDTMLNNMPLNRVVLRLRSFFRHNFEALAGPLPWFDKNAVPSIIPYLGVVQDVWDDAAFIYAKRRPIDLIASALRKFPNQPFEHFCEMIEFTTRNWEEQKRLLKKYVEVDQSELLEPEKLADKLIGFLRMDSDRRSALIEGLQNQVERTAVSYEPSELADLNLSTAQIELFNKTCGSLMRQY
jgi:hypothetical protein